MAVHILNHRRQPVVRHLDVRVQQQIVLRLDLPQGLVVTLGETPVLVELDQPDLWEMLSEQCQRAVRRGIVGHIDRRLVPRIAQHGGQILPEHLLPVPVQYDDCHLLFHLARTLFNI